MCGIAGIVSLNKNNNELVNSLPVLLDAIKHRGPDDEGCVFFSQEKIITTYGKDTPENVKASNSPYSPKNSFSSIQETCDIGLGHRRLSIIDLSELGHQPMCDSSEKYWIVYNGEIYNYRELKEELTTLGHVFKSETDTEVLIAAYIEWGEKCLDRLNGMWSFVIYDRINNELFGARDRFGVKPFYYIKNDHHFLFASEIKSLVQTPNFKRELNPKAVYDYLVIGKLEVDDESLFKGIFELKPSHSFKLNLSDLSFNIKKYYELSINDNWNSFNKKQFKDYSKRVYEKTYHAINLRLNADVKTGTCLSGGLDSSIVTCVTNDILKNKSNETLQELFTATYPSKAINEEHWAKIVVDSTNTNWHNTNPTAAQLEEQLEDLIYYQDIPFTSSSSFSQYKVMELAKQSDIKVTLDGQAADELFGGYPPHYVSAIYNSLKMFSFNSFFNNIGGVKSNFSVRSQLISAPLKYFFAKFFKSSYKRKLIKSQPELKFINESLWKLGFNNLHLKNDGFNSNLNKLLAYQFTQYTLKHILRLSDRNAMRFSIESRMPFADDINLIEEVFQIPGSYKIRNGVSKYLLRDAFKELLPKEIYNRNDKIGFSTPEKDWFKELKPYFKQVIFEQNSDEFVDWKGIQENFETIYNNAINTSTQRLWRLINFAIWRKLYSV